MIRLENICISYGSFYLKNINFEVPKGSYAVLSGKSGSGKSTLLEIICGLKRQTKGQVFIDNRDVSFDLPGCRNIGYVPQDLALFPNLNVKNQIAFGLQLRGHSDLEINTRVSELVELFDLKHVICDFPKNLSGGEAQRVALARALASRPRILCLDEPLSGLDADLHDTVCHYLKSVFEASQYTVLHVTHNKDEAKRLSTQFFEISNNAIFPIN